MIRGTIKVLLEPTYVGGESAPCVHRRFHFITVQLFCFAWGSHQGALTVICNVMSSLSVGVYSWGNLYSG